MSNRLYIKLSFWLLSIFFFVSCDNNPLKVDVSGIDVNLKIKRFDLAVDSLRTNYSDKQFETFQNQYAAFAELYSTNIIRVGSIYNADYIANLRSFFSYPIYNELFESCKNDFADYGWIESDLTEAFKHFKYYYPAIKIPEVYTFISGFNHSVVLDENILAIGLDKYLGAESNFYKQLQVERYLSAKMTPERIVVDCMHGIAESEFKNGFEKEHLLSAMIHEGRLQYFVKAMLPEYPDSLIMGYSKSQMEFCAAYEQNMWNYLVEKKLLFNSEHMNIIRFIGPSPFTAPFSHDSPGQTGVWLGYRIVSSYMENNKDVTLQDLMQETDFQKIMNKSRYNP